MQADNYNYKPDEQFTNSGWEAMQKKLDKEMPVERKKRRGVIWFYFLGTMLLAGGIWFLQFRKYQTTIPEQKEKVFANSEVDKQEKQVGNQNQNQNANQNQIDNAQPLNGKNQNQKNIGYENSLTKNEILKSKKEELVNHSATPKKSTGQSLYNNKNANNGSSVFEEQNSIAFPEVPFNSTANSAGLISEEVVNEIVALDNANASRESLTMSSISFLKFYLEEKVRQNPEIDMEVLKEKLAKKVERKGTPKRKIELGLNVGALLDVENSQRLGGITTASIHFPLSKKMGIRTGLGYSLINKDLFYQYTDQQTAEYYDPITVVSNPPSAAVGNIDVNTTTIFNLNRFHYLEIPLLFTYEAHKKWQFLLGANASYLIKDQLTSVESGFGFLNEADALSLGIDLASVSAESLDLEQFQKQDYWNKWNMSAVFGMAFKITPRWNIELQYHRSFSSFLETNEDGLYFDQRFSNPSTNSNSGYYIQNDFNDPSGSSESRVRDLNTNHSLRFTIGYKF